MFRLRFSVRTLAVVITAIAIVLGTVVQRIRTQEQAIAALEIRGFDVETRLLELPWGLHTNLPAEMVLLPKSARANFLAPQFDVRWLNCREEMLEEQNRPPFHEKDLRHLSALRQVEMVSLEHAPITDEGLVHLQNLTNLRELFLSNYDPSKPAWKPRITDAGLIYLRGLDKLELLHLDGHDIGDDGLASFLSELKELKQLDIARTQVSDESIECIAGLKSLKSLVITDTDITDAGAIRLKERLPHCYIQR